MRIKRADRQRDDAEEQIGNIDVQVIYVVFHRGRFAILQISGEHQKQRHTGRRQQPQPGQQIAAHTGYVVCRQAAVANAVQARDQNHGKAAYYIERSVSFHVRLLFCCLYFTTTFFSPSSS